MKKELPKNFKKLKVIAMLAPSFVAEFKYPEIISKLHALGFDKVVELTFGAKMVNRLYHKYLENTKQLLIASVCPGVVSFIKSKYPQYTKNLARIDSPMIAMAKICKKIYPKHKLCFISPCNFKKQEAQDSNHIDYVLGYDDLNSLFASSRCSKCKKKKFERFYNEYTRIYPLSGGLSKTSHLKGVLKKGEEKVIDGILEVEKFIKNPDKKVRFLDCTFCHGGCIGGPLLTSKNLELNKKKVLDYMQLAKKEKIAKTHLGLVERAAGIEFTFH